LAERRRLGRRTFRDGCRNLDGVGLLALEHSQTRAATEHAVEFVFEQVDGLVEVVRGNRCDQIVSANLNDAFGQKLGFAPFGRLVAEIHADPHDLRFVVKQLLHLFPDDPLERIRQVEICTGDDEVAS